MEIWNGISFALIKILLPLAGIGVLIMISVLLYQMVQTIKKANTMVDDVQEKVAIFDPIFDGIANFEASYTGVGNMLSGVAVSAARARANKKKRDRQK
ncbi:hypothetical protein [Mycoplasma sp. P36-A1]|uniref:hypothetical protein n=1 Tax=Mycoplasma sp. P36-A1 TaxID=3252900 RepID=UPI003C2F6CDE